MKRIKLFIISIGVVVSFGLAALPANTYADDADGFNPFERTCTNGAGDSEICQADGNIGGFLTTIVDVLLFIIGAAAVIMIIVGGFTYVLSNGDPGLIKTSKDRILYAVIGIVVALSAYAIVHFVVARLTPAKTTSYADTTKIIEA